MAADDHDPALLQAYLDGSQAAFAALVGRYLPLVQNAAARQTADATTADDVQQAVFILLARKARALTSHQVLAGWLLQATCYCAANARKLAQRRTVHEQQAAAMKPESISTPDVNLADLSPHLDSALASLSSIDRNAVCLHYLQRQTLEQVGDALGISKDATHKRITRALEKLRKRLARHGLMLSAAALATLLTTESLSAAPISAAIVSTIAANAIAAAHGTLATGAAITLAKGAATMMAMLKLKAAALVVATIIVLFGGAMILHESLAANPVAATMPASKPLPVVPIRQSQPPTPTANELTLKLGNGAMLKLVEIPAGKFLMGSPETENGHRADETLHQVTISKPFYMGVTHVTVDQFAAFVKDSFYQTEAEHHRLSEALQIKDGALELNQGGGFSWRNPGFAQKGDHPVVMVSFKDATAFCDWLSKKSGRTVALPTEAQWEYACRAGTTTAYPWGDDPDDGQGWTNGADQSLKRALPNAPATMRFFSWDDGFVFTSPVASFKANAFGLYDMIGNAAQWCQDRYGDYETGAAIDPTGAVTGDLRMLRGSSWNSSIRQGRYRSAARLRYHPLNNDNDVGFRVVASTQPADDAAKLYLQAAKLIGDNATANIISPSSSVVVYPAYPPYPAEWYRAEKAAFAANAAVFALVHQARAIDHADWPQDSYQSPDGTSSYKYLGACRGLSNELADAALYQHFQGDDAAAIETLRDHLHLADLLEDQPDKKLICLLAAGGIRVQCMAGCQIITSNVALTKDALNNKALQAKTAREVIRELLRHPDGETDVCKFAQADPAEARSIGVAGIYSHIALAKRVNTERDLAAMSLACHVYRFDTGNWPKTVDDLHDYLRSVPVDKWGDGKQTMGYALIKGGLPDGSDRPLVYCRYQMQDGLFFRTDQPFYALYIGDGSGRPADEQKHGGQFRDVASWAPPEGYHPAAATQPVKE